jgi:mevalonate kinase
MTKLFSMQAPGKIIISGEHAVVHGAPALVTAVNRYARVEMIRKRAVGIDFNLRDFDHRTAFAVDELSDLYDTSVARREAFSRDEFQLGDILMQPSDLIPLAYETMRRDAASTGSGTANADVDGVLVTVDTDIPIGCGMGASSAVIVGVLATAAKFFQHCVSVERLYELAVHCERFQHLRPSGADPYTCLHGGCLRFCQGNVEKSLPTEPLPMYLVNSGTRAATTGECVRQVAHRFGDTDIWDDFTAVTDAIDAAIDGNDTAALYDGVRRNDELLRRIGVVPERVGRFIDEVSAADGAAKITGAGSIRGDGGGMVLIFAESAPADLCAAYGYELLDVEGEARGVHDTDFSAG